MKENYIKVSKRLLISFCLACISVLGMATTYYVSNAGLDTNNGLSATTSWKTLDKVNTIAFLAGDQILFQRGSTFYGSLIIKRSGNAGNPITYGAYGSGANPIFNGLVSAADWTNTGNNIWVSTNNVSSLSDCNMVLINNINTPMGRYPNAGTANAGYIQYQSFNGNGSITSSSLNGSPNWTGAEAVIKTQRFSIDRTVIASQSGGTLILKIPTVCTPTNNYGFFIQNDLRTLDAQNEWYFNPGTKKISVYSINKPTNVQVASIDKIITVNANNIVLDNLTIIGANGFGIFHWSHDPNLTNLTIQNCNVQYSGQDAINVFVDRLNILNNKISDSNNKAIEISASTNIVVDNNNIRNSGVLLGMHQANGTFSAVQVGGVSNTTVVISGNTIINSAHNAMTIGADNTTVRNNFIDTYCTLIDDGAAIYGGHNALITSNIIINGIGNSDGTYGTFPAIAAGIYPDGTASNLEISNNSVFNAAYYGIFLDSNAASMTISGNTVLNSSSAQMRINYPAALSTLGFNVHDNIFVSKKANQYTAYYNSVVNNIPSTGSYKANYYVRPLDDNRTIQASQPSEYGGKYLKTLAEWQLFTGQDAAAHKSPVALTNENDIQFAYNSTTAAITVTLAQPMMDVKGVKYASSVTLQPFTSVVLLRDYNGAKGSTKSVSICNGSNYNGWTTSGTYTQTLKAKSGADSIVTVYLTVNPTYNISENVTINAGQNYNGWTTAGTYVRNLSTKLGCDSIVTTHLTVTTVSNPPPPPGIPFGSYITLKGNNNMFVSSENGRTAMNCNRVYAYAYEKFLVVDAGGGLVALQCGSNGLYISGNSALWCTGTTIGAAQKFSWISPSAGQVQFKCSSNNLFITSENGTTTMNCNRASGLAWETFTWAVSTKSANTTESEPLTTGETVNIYPTLATDVLKIDNNLSGVTNLTIYDLTGHLILNKVINPGFNEIDVLSFKKDVYIVKITNGTYLKTTKIVVE